MPAELLATPPSPSLFLVAQHFVGMALQHDYLSTGRGHHQSHRVLAERQKSLARLRPGASSSSKLEDEPSTAAPAHSTPRSFTDAEQQYLSHVASQPRLSSAEEYSLAKRMRSGDTQARNALIQANLGLVVMFARRHLRPGLSLLDLVAEGNMGLFTSAERFDPEMGFRFATYAKWWVLHGIRSAVRRHNEAHGLFPTASGGSDSTESSPATEWPGTTLRDSETACASSQSDTSMEAADHDEEPPQVTQLQQRNRYLRRALEKLSDRERVIIGARYALTEEEEQTLAMLAHRLNLSIERVRQIERAALQKLGHALADMGVSASSLF